MEEKMTNIGGRLHDVSVKHTVTGANEVMDDNLEKKQDVINAEQQETNTRQSVINQETDEHLDVHDTEIADRYTKEEVNNIISRTPETNVIVIEIPVESQSNIADWLDANTPSGTDPETGRSVRANKLYRVPGPDNTTFSEWAWDGTKYIMLANKDYGIDDEPTDQSANTVKSGGVFNKLKYTKIIEIHEVSALSPWQQLERPIKGLVSIKGNNPIRIAKSTSKSENTITVKLSSKVDRVYLYLDDDYTYYFNDNQSDNFNVVIEHVDIADVFGGIVSESYLTGWVKGYYNEGRFNPSDDTDWVSCVIDVEPGKTYFLPYSNTNSVQPIVNLDSNGDFVSVNKQGDTGKVYNTFAIVKAVTPKIGITYYLKCGSLGSSIIFNDLCKFPYICLSDSKYCNPYKECLDLKESNPIQNLLEMFDFKLTSIPASSWIGGYYSPTMGLVTEDYGGWRYSLMATIPGEYYLVNCSFYKNVRVFDMDGNGNTTTNNSISDLFYDNESESSWAIVKAKYNTLGICFIDPTGRDSRQYKAPKYVRLERTNNNGLLFTIIQCLLNNHAVTDLVDFRINEITEYENGYYNKVDRLETQDYGGWRYAVIDVEPNEWYLVNCSLYHNVRIFDVYEDDSMRVNTSVSDKYYDTITSSKLTWALVKTNGVGLGLNFIDPSISIGVGYGLPKYIKLSKGEYQGIVFPIMQAMFSTSYGFDGLNMKKIVEYSPGYFSKDGHLETQNVGDWKYALIDTVPGNYYILETSMLRNIRIFDMDEQGRMSINRSVSDAEYTVSNSNKFVIVKAASVKIGVSFLETYNKIPSYCDISTPNNAISIILNKINNVGAGKTLIVSKNGDGDYTSFVRAIMDNYGKWGVTLHLNEGVYDLFEEFEEYYGTANFLNLTKYGRGLELGYNITVEGSPNAIIKADYTGNDAGIQQSFSPINCTKDVNGGGYTLRGVNIRCSRVRYAVHDEKTSTGLGNYSNVYDNCNFYIDNTDNDTWHSSACIGGGLGTSGNIVVKNCIFESVDPAFTGAAVSWHNNSNEGAKSQISCVGNVVKGNRGFRFSWYGYSQEITEVICTDNNVGAATIIRAETGPDSPWGPSPYENIEVFDWNNVIRN